MNYCGECEHQPEFVAYKCKGQDYCRVGKMWCAPNHPACAVFSAKKRTCGECIYPYRDRKGNGLCIDYYDGDNGKDYICVSGTSEACDNFKEEA